MSPLVSLLSEVRLSSFKNELLILFSVQYFIPSFCHRLSCGRFEFNMLIFYLQHFLILRYFLFSVWPFAAINFPLNAAFAGLSVYGNEMYSVFFKKTGIFLWSPDWPRTHCAAGRLKRGVAVFPHQPWVLDYRSDPLACFTFSLGSFQLPEVTSLTCWPFKSILLNFHIFIMFCSFHYVCVSVCMIKCLQPHK